MLSCFRRGYGLALPLVLAVWESTSAAPPTFEIRPPGNEQAFVGSSYKAVLVAAGCPEPSIVVDSPAGAIFEDDTLKYVPAGAAGTTFRVRVRAVNADGEAVADWEVTLVGAVDLEFDAAAEYTGNFDPHLENVPASQRSDLAAEVRAGSLMFDAPGTGPGPADNLDSWCGYDRSPRWWSKIRVFGAFEMETRFSFPKGITGDPSYGYHVGLALDRGKEDLLIHGAIRDRVEYERTCRWDGDGSPFGFFPGISTKPVSLRIVVDGKEQTFWARLLDTDPWMRIGTIGGARPAIRGVGLALKTWADRGPFTAAFQYFRYRGISPGPPGLSVPEDDHTFSGGEYCLPLNARSDLPLTLVARSPAGASIGPDRVFRCPVSGPPGTSFEASVSAANSKGEVLRTWKVFVERPERLDFDRPEDFTDRFFDPGTDGSTRRDEIVTRVAGGRLEILVPPAGEEDFDSWCGFDRSPRWLHRSLVTGSYAAETSMVFIQFPPRLPEGYHVGLAVDRGHQDLALLGAIREGVEYERTCGKGCENTGTFFPGGWNKPGQRFFLRMEAECGAQVFLARREGDESWTAIAGVEGRRPQPLGIGLGLKNYAGEGAFSVGYDFFEYGLRGARWVEVPSGGEVLAGTLYQTRVRALGVHPLYSIAEPAGATIDRDTGEISYTVPAAAPGTTIRFTVRAQCGLEREPASWSLTVVAAEPGVEVTAVEPQEFSVLGKTPFVVRGANFTVASRILIEGAELSTQFLGEGELRSVAPSRAPAPSVAGTVRDPVRGEAGFAVSYVGPFEVTGIDPGVAVAGQHTVVTVRGSGFTPGTQVKIAQQTLPVEYVDVRTLRARVPPLDEGVHDVAVVDQDDKFRWFTDSLTEGFTVLARLDLASVSPTVVSCLGKTPLEIRGEGFTPQTRLFIGGLAVPLEYMDETTLRGIAPAHASGTATVLAIDPLTGRAEIPAGIAYVCDAATGLRLESISPQEMMEGQPVAVEIKGVGFTPETGIRFGTLFLEGKVFVDATAIRGRTPALAAGIYSIVAVDRDAGGKVVSDVLQEQPFTVRKEEPPVAFIPGPRQIEGAIGEGKIRFRWYNPVEYESILVLDGEGNPLPEVPGVLPGDAEELVLQWNGQESFRLQFQGITAEGLVSEPSHGRALIRTCEDGVRVSPRGLLGPFEFTLHGGHEEAVVNPCGGEVECWSEGECIADPEWQIVGPFDRSAEAATADPPRGFFRTADLLATVPDRNKVITGFTLRREALKLEIAAYYEKLAPHPGGSLRGRLTLVRPFAAAVPLFDDEFFFPSALPGAPKAWNSSIYTRTCPGASYTAPGCPGPGVPDVLPIHPGDYRLEIYAVGGEDRPYYLFASDLRDEPYLIPGVPCPPYPAVEVTDMTGLVTLPEIERILFISAVDSGGPTSAEFPISALFRIEGTWKDACGASHPIPAIRPEDRNPYFEYEWIFDDDPPLPPQSSENDQCPMLLREWKCYKVTVIARDVRCDESRTLQQQVSVYPRAVSCPTRYHSFLFPQPDPGGIYAIAGLDPPPGNGSFEVPRPIEFKVMVVPECFCDATPGPGCRPAAAEDVQFRLAKHTGGPVDIVTVLASSNPNNPVDPASPIHVENLCGQLEEGKPSYFAVKILDANRIADRFGPHDFTDVYLEAATVRGQGKPPGEPLQWNKIGRPMHFTNSPPCLASAIWTGYFDEKDASYRFTVLDSPDGQIAFDDPKMRFTAEIQLPIEGQDVRVPRFENRLNVAFASRFRMQDGVWGAETTSGMASGLIISNELNGAPLEVAPSSGGGLGAGGGFGEPFEWCLHEPLLRDGLRQTLFESLLYAGLIGPVPVELWGTVEFGMDYGVDAYVDARVSPFAAMGGGNFVEKHFSLKSNVSLYMPCSVRADVLFGVFSVAARLIPAAEFILDTQVGCVNARPEFNHFASATLSLSFEAEACVDLLLWEECWKDTRLLWSGSLLEPSGTPFSASSCAPAGGGGALDLGGDVLPGAAPAVGGGGNGPASTVRIYIEESAPATAISPDGETTLDAYVDAEGHGVVVFDDDQAIPISPGLPVFYEVRDPSAAFIANDVALAAFTHEPTSAPPPANPLDPTLPERNAAAAVKDISIFRFRKPFAWSLDSDPITISEAPGAPLEQKRADGRPSLVAAPLAAAPWALVAWVRYETYDFFLREARPRRILQPTPSGTFAPVNLIDYPRPQLERTAIYGRRLNADGTPAGPSRRISPPGIGINLEPVLGITPKGTVACCVWVNDPSHVNLTDSNLGRRLLFSRYRPELDRWDAPIEAVRNPDDYPGILEPAIAIREDARGGLDGILAFTALERGAPERDTGLYGSQRYIYVAYLEDGVFGEPELLHQRCTRRTKGHWITLGSLEGSTLVEIGGAHFRPPEWIMGWQGIDAIGTPEGAGGLLVSVLPQGSREWTRPVRLTERGFLVSNSAMAFGEAGLRTIHLDGGDARISKSPAGGGAPAEPAFRARSTLLQPDLAILSTSVSDPFATPGGRFTFTAEIENQGLSGSAVSPSGESLVRLKIVVFGQEVEELALDVPEIAPGASTRIEIPDAEMLLDPARVVISLDPNPGDVNRANDSRELFLGVPAPEDVTCEPRLIPDEARSLAAHVRWGNAMGYEGIDLYRDGLIITTLPGTSTSYVDLDVRPGKHRYEVRGRLRGARSLRSAVACTILSPGELLRRGDVDANGVIEITDPINLLGFLFLGSGALPCPDAADADDNGILEITDPIRILGFLFLGSAEPPAPGPRTCGPDPTEDGLGLCNYTCE